MSEVKSAVSRTFAESECRRLAGTRELNLIDIPVYISPTQRHGREGISICKFHQPINTQP